MRVNQRVNQDRPAQLDIDAYGVATLHVNTRDQALVDALAAELIDCEPTGLWRRQTMSWEQAAAYLRISVSTLRRRVDAGQIPMRPWNQGTFLVGDLDDAVMATGTRPRRRERTTR